MLQLFGLKDHVVRSPNMNATDLNGSRLFSAIMVYCITFFFFTETCSEDFTIGTDASNTDSNLQTKDRLGLTASSDTKCRSYPY